MQKCRRNTYGSVSIIKEGRLDLLRVQSVKQLQPAKYRFFEVMVHGTTLLCMIDDLPVSSPMRHMCQQISLV